MDTLEKVQLKLEEAQDLEDQDLHVIPFVPPTLVRGVLRFIAKRLPDDPGEMEEHVHRALEFLESLLPDPDDDLVIEGTEARLELEAGPEPVPEPEP